MNCRTVHDSLPALSVFLLLSLVTAAPGSRPTAITWAAPEACPSTEAFVAAMRFRTERITVVGADETPTAWVDATIERLGTQFSGRLTVRLASGATTRQLAGTRCETVMAALSLFAALLIDPENAKTGPLPAVVAAAPPPIEPPPIEPPPEQPSTPPTVTETRPAAPIPSAPAVTTEAPPPTTAAFRLWGAVHATTAISGLLDVGGTVSVSLTLNRFLARLSLGGGSGSTVQGSVGRALYPFHLLASAEAGVHFSAGVFVADATLAATALITNVTSVDAVEPQRVWRWLLPVGPALRAGFRVGGWLFGASVFAGLNTRRDTYQVTPDGDVFTTPAFFIHPALFVSPSI